MKKALLALTSVIALGACTTERIVERVPDTPPPAITTPLVPSASEKEALYMESIASEFPSVVNKFGKEFVLNFGYTVCEEIDRGMTIEDLLQMTSAYDVDPEMVGYMVGQAIRIFCPENQWFIDGATAGI